MLSSPINASQSPYWVTDEVEEEVPVVGHQHCMLKLLGSGPTSQEKRMGGKEGSALVLEGSQHQVSRQLSG